VDVRVADDPTQLRYELTVEGELAGEIRYRRQPGALVLVHTELEPRFEGRGLGARLVRGALDDIRDRGLLVVPFCPFVRSYIQRHQEYEPLVTADTELPE
jgi:predicted GNAT family acetyltransferase